MAPAPLPYLWNARAYSYVDPVTKRFVSGKDVRDATDRALKQASARMADLAVQLRERRIPLAVWERKMMEEIRSAHLYSAALAKGGFAQMTPADYGRAGREIRTQYDFLRKRAAAIRSGKQRLDGTLTQRAALYAQAARGTYHETERREMDVRGFREGRRVRNKRDSCVGCKREEARGWVPVGDVARIGSQECLTLCGCYIAYRNPDTGQSRAA